MGARTLVLGLDGATWAVLEPHADRLPHLARLWRGGARAALRSTIPPLTLPAWSSVLTGAGPGAHGIVDFTRRVPGSYRLELLNATHRRLPTAHRVLSDRGRRVASVAVPGTWPPEPVNGVVVAGFDSPVATAVEAVHCAPRALHRELERRFGGLRFADFQEARLDDAWLDRARASLLREIGRKEAVCRWLLDREPWDWFMVVFGESDTAAHHFWMFHDPASPRHRPGREGLLLDVYRRLDAAVGVLAARAETVCVVSDHGFGPADTLAVYPNRRLEEGGWLRFREGGGALERARAAALGLPVERAVRRLPGAWLGAAEARARWGAIDLARSRAWSDEMNYAATVHLNLRGRDPWGTVDDAEAATRALEAWLREWRVDGRPVVDRVVRRAEAAPGADGPDLVLELALRDGASPVVLPSTRVPAGVTARRLGPEEHLGGKGRGTNGAHRPEGVLVLHGPAFRAGVEVGAGVADVLPTLFHAAGEAIPAHVEGRVLAEALRRAAPERRVEVPVPAPAPVPHRPADAHRIAERLARLGYG